MSAAVVNQLTVAARPAAGKTLPPEDGAAGPVPLAIFLDQVAGLLQAGLPARLWIAATVLDARASAAGHTLELADPALERGGASLRTFLTTGALAAIRRDLGVPVDPVLLVGMTTTFLVCPSFSRRWHLGGRVEAIGREIAASLRARLLDRVVATLKQERLWDRQHALPRPADVTRIAVIHPAGAAGWGDIAGELARWERAGLVHVRSLPAAFEGERAADAIAAALRVAAEPIAGSRPDLILVVRGGGAKAALLLALDEDVVARAILACPVPVVTGTGHAQDRSLADRVAWAAMDTPSKAVALVGDILLGQARGAAAHRSAIRVATATVLLAEGGRLDGRRHELLAALARCHASADRQLDELWSIVRAERRGGVGRLDLEGAALDRHLDAVLGRVPQHIEVAGHVLQQLLHAGLGRAASRLADADDGGALLSDATSRARTGLERATGLLQREEDAIAVAAARLLDREAAALDRLAAAIDAADPDRLLQRGFALVTDDYGRLLPSRAVAAVHARLRLRFSDGELAAMPAG